MASTHKHIRSGTAHKRPTTAIADGQIALATNSASPGLFFKDSTGASIIKIGPVHVGATAPNASPAGSAGNSTGEIWLDNSLTPVGVKIWNGSAWVNATPVGTTTVQGLLELATSAETQAGSDTDRAVTPAGLQSKLSDSISTTSSTTIASSTAVKAAYDLANAALPKSGGTVTGNLEIGTTGSLTFEGATADAFETTLAVVDPTADRTITLPNTTGTVVTTGDTGTVTSTMLLDGTILNEDINASAAIAYSKLATLTSTNIILGSSANVATSTAVTGDVTISNTGVTAISSGVIVNADVNASAAIAGTKIAPDFGAQNITTTGSSTAATFNPTGTTPSVTGIYSPGANRLGITTNSVERVEFGTSEVVFNDDAADYDFRIEGDTNTNLFFADASAEAVGIRTATPVSELNVSVGNGGNITISNTNDTHSAGLAFGDTTSNSAGRISYDHNTNALAISTNGTQRATIDSSGRLLVGTSTARSNLYAGSLTAALQVEGTTYSTSSLSMIANGSGSALNPYPIFYLGRSRGASVNSNTIVASGDNIGSIVFTGADGTNLVPTAAIECFVDGTPGAGDMPGRLVFSTTPDGSSTPTERLRITSAGLLGLGTSSPTGVLEVGAVTGAVTSGDLLVTTGSTTASVTVGRASGTGSDNTTFNVRNRVGTSVFYVDTGNGRVGINNTSPSSLLHLVSSGQPKITVADDGGRTLQIHAPDSSANPGFIGTTTNHDLLIQAGTTAGGLNVMRFNTAGAERVRITDTGRVGIGTTSPVAKLTVVSTSSVNGVNNCTLRSSDNASSSFYIGHGPTSVVNIASDSNIGFGYTDNTTYSERMRLDTSGRLLVGTSTAVLSSKFLSQFAGNTENGAVLNETANTANTTFLAFALSGTAIGSVARVGSTSAVIYNTTSDYRLKTIVGSVTGQGERIDALKPIDFQWKENGEQSRGFLAHEFQTVYANSVTGEKDAVDADGKPVYQAMQASTPEIIADLVAEIQQLRTRVAALEAA